jgi:hypothetical protein
METAMTQTKSRKRTQRRSRLVQALDVLRGQQLHPLELQAQFLEIQVSYEGMLNKLSLALTRLAKREQRDVERKMASIAPPQNGDPRKEVGEAIAYGQDKAALRRHVFGQKVFLGGTERAD